MKFRNLFYVYISLITILFNTSQFLLSQTTDTPITVNKENIREHTYQLGSDRYQGRGTGTEGESEAAKDGAPSSDVGAEPWAYPVIYNATFLGSGKESCNADQDQLIKMRENWGGEYKNSIFGDYAGIGVDIENKTTPDSKLRLDEGSLLLENNLWFDFSAGVVFDSLGKHDYVIHNIGHPDGTYDYFVYHFPRTAVRG